MYWDSIVKEMSNTSKDSTPISANKESTFQSDEPISNFVDPKTNILTRNSLEVNNNSKIDERNKNCPSQIDNSALNFLERLWISIPTNIVFDIETIFEKPDYISLFQLLKISLQIASLCVMISYILY